MLTGRAAGRDARAPEMLSGRAADPDARAPEMLTTRCRAPSLLTSPFLDEVTACAMPRRSMVTTWLFGIRPEGEQADDRGKSRG